MKKIIALLIVLTTSTFYAQQFTTPSVQVYGEGIVRVVPDQAVINLGVENQGKTAQEVKLANDVVINEVISFLRKMDIPENLVKTERINLRKQVDYNNPEKITYYANQSISIVLKNLAKYEDVMRGLLETGVNNIDGVNFTSSKVDLHNAKARELAIKDAQSKAKAYAGVLGQTIGKALFISESSDMSSPQPVFRKALMASDSGAPQETKALGEMVITQTIQVLFELK